jgi:DNA-binding NarL/FixJ family response regulator
MTDGTMAPISVLIVDDHPVVRFGLWSLLSQEDDIRVIAEADNGPSGLTAARLHQPDVVLLDIQLGGLDGIEVAKRLRESQPRSKIIILTNYDDDSYVVRALQAEVHGYLLKHTSVDTLVDAIRTVHRGERLLSPPLLDRVIRDFSVLRQTQTGLTTEDREVLMLLARGASNADIAASLHWSATSVKRRLQEIFVKLQVSSRAQAAAEAVRRGLV